MVKDTNKVIGKLRINPTKIYLIHILSDRDTIWPIFQKKKKKKLFDSHVWTLFTSVYNSYKHVKKVKVDSNRNLEIGEEWESVLGWWN